MILLKGGRSGSTWLSSLIQEIRGPRGASEIYCIHEAQGCANNTRELEQYLTEVAANRRDMFRSRHRCERASRTLRERASKCCALADADASWRSVVLTLQPFHEPPGTLALDAWDRVLGLADDARRVPLVVGLLLRSNVVKWAISRIQGERIAAMCGTHKVQASNNECLARIDQQRLAIEPRELRLMIRDVLQRTHALVHLAHQLAARSKRPLLAITYEQLQLNFTAPLARLADALELDAGTQLPQRADKVYIKTGQDDLASYVATYDALERDLRAYPCLHAQLRAVEPRDFAPCQLQRAFVD